MFARRVGSPLGVAITQEITRSLFGRQTAAERIRELLFGSGQQGAFYVPQPTVDGEQVLYQDSAGTTPVTADGQPVGLMLDLHKGLVRGPELVTNGTFDSDTAGWTARANTTLSIVEGRLRATAIADGSFGLDYTYLPNPSGFYSVQFTVKNSAGLTLYIGIQGDVVIHTDGFIDRIGKSSGDGRFSAATSGGASAGDYFEIDNISVRELPGNHATQSTSAARPIYRTDGTLHWLQFDGVDDCLFLQSINLLSLYFSGALHPEVGVDVNPLISNDHASGALNHIFTRSINEYTVSVDGGGSNTGGIAIDGGVVIPEDLLGKNIAYGSVINYPSANSTLSVYHPNLVPYSVIGAVNGLYGDIALAGIVCTQSDSNGQKSNVENYLAALAGVTL